jgi:tetratricopeptide (TPR) repeat protein
MLRETQPDTIGRALRTYGDCMLKQADVDTVRLRGWLTRSLSRFGLYQEELAMLTRTETPDTPIGRTLFSLAQRHFSRRRHQPALVAARAAYERVSREDLRSLCATIIYQSYVRQGKSDSALTWLKRADLSTARARMQAAVLYQQSGSLAKADSIVGLLHPGINRDTLAIRQLLFEGNPDSAAEAALALGSRGDTRQLRQLSGLWRVRSLLFATDMASFKQTLESLRFPPTWPYAAEMLRHRYSFERVKTDPAAMSTWAQLEYALYRGEPEDAIPSLRAESYSGPAAALLVLRLARALLQDNRPAKARTVLAELDAAQAPPEHMYYCAEALYELGEPGEARELLQELIMAHPQDIFSSKARVLLQKTQS